MVYVKIALDSIVYKTLPVCVNCSNIDTFKHEETLHLSDNNVRNIEIALHFEIKIWYLQNKTILST